MTVPLLPRAVLFGDPSVASPRISPDGTELAWLGPVDGTLQVHASAMSELTSPRVLTQEARSVLFFFWAFDRRHLIYLTDTDGDENWHLVAVDLQTGRTRALTPTDGVQAGIDRVDHRHPHQIAVSLNIDDPHWPDLYRIDLRDGSRTKILDNPGLASFVVGSDLEARGGTLVRDDGGMKIVVREPDGTWSGVLAVGHEDALSTDVLGITADHRRLWVVSSADRATGRLLAIDVADGTRTPIAGHPDFDIAGARLNPHTGEVQFSAVLADRLIYTAHDPAVQADLAGLARVERGDMVLHGGDQADRVWIVAFIGDTHAARYYAWDRDTRSARPLMDQMPQLAADSLAPMESLTMRARDGLELPGYLTLPLHGPRTELPCVVLVHGGPWARDQWGFQPEPQWLADRGYACLQVNFRGSTGYGKALTNAGDRQWGAEMQDDLVDAVQQLIERGVVDRSRVAIMGGSYGGYAALMAAVRDPDVFCCAVDLVGPTNLVTFSRSLPAAWTPLLAQFRHRLGDPYRDADLLWSRSPLAHLDGLRVPLLIAQGGNDPRVPAAESEQLVEALRSRGIEHEYLFFPDEGHNLVRTENRLRFYAAAERFLGRHLAGRVED